MDPMANRIKVWKYFKGLTIETSNFGCEVKFILGLESPCPDGWGAKIGLNATRPNRVKVWRYVLGLTIDTNNFAFEVKFILSLESNYLDG